MKHLPSDQRPRERLRHRGPKSLTDAELIALFLRTGTRGKSVTELAQEVLSNFGDLVGVLNANEKELCRINGIGPTKFIELQAALELSKRYLRQRGQRQTSFENPSACRDYLACELRGLAHEVFSCLFLDTRNRLIIYEELFRGTIDQSSVYPRDVLKAALSHGAKSVIFAHNHPSGLCDPSEADKLITQRLQSALSLVDIQVLDHFIVGDGQVLSFAEQGLL